MRTVVASASSIVRPLLLCGLALLASCAKSEGQAKQGGIKAALPFPVEVSPVEARKVDYSVSAVGSVDAFEVVQVTARVAGAIDAVRFTEGDAVRKGTTIVEIDPDRYRIAVNQAKAVLAKSEATLGDAQASLKRREELNAKTPGIVREEELEGFRAKAHELAAEVAQNRAALELAELNLRDALVKAPVNGVIQTRTVQTGQYVQPGAVMATLVRRDPLLLRLRVPEYDAGPLRPGMKLKFRVRGDDRDYGAEIMHVAESAEAGTRMVPVTARVDAAGESLRPGAFTEIRIPVGGADSALVIPLTAVRPSDKGFLAYVVDGTVAHERVLTLGMRTEDGKVEVRTGLKAGESLVIRGGEALREGAKVVVEQASPPVPSVEKQLPAKKEGGTR